MVEIKDEELLTAMRSRVQEQGDKVRSLKKSNASEADLKIALSELKRRKKLLEDKELELMPPIPSFDRGKLEDLLKQKFFYDQSFAIYGGVQGLYDFGPMGCAMKANLLAAWRQHFILEDHLLEVDCAMLTPAPVLQASGHVERFTDLMVKDVKTGECFRADHFVKGHLEAKANNKKTSNAEKAEIEKILIQLDNFGSKELDALLRRYDMKSTTTNNDVSEPQEFNLMFATMIGPTGQCKGYLRPETAQGIFVNFQRLLQFNQGRLPFGAAQIGSAFRNEISPRSGLIRVREFTMAEIEYFVDPNNKTHPKFDQVRNVELSLYSGCDQMDGRSSVNMTIGEAVAKRIVANETLGYFMARIHQFLLHVGVDRNRLRFRQHLSNEMAHYACDCWDAECLTSYGWIECVGCADRSCYDLMQHTKATGCRLTAEKKLSEPRSVRVCECVPNKQAIGKAFRGDAKSITDALAALKLDDAMHFKDQMSQNGQSLLRIDGKSFAITEPMVKIKEYDQTLHVEEIVPNVIEPSFGIGRVLYAVFEHSFRIRDGDEQRTYLSVPPVLAPYKCSLLPLSNQPDFTPFIKQISSALTSLGVSHRIDESSGSIGRRYARTDQIAIPYGVTIDFDTVNKSPASATLRERDSMKQIRVPLTDLPTIVHQLSTGQSDWTEVQTRYPAFEQQETGLHEQNAVKPTKEKRKATQTAKKDQPGKVKAGQKRAHPSSTTQPKHTVPIQENVDPAVQIDDWQSVTEEVGDVKDSYPDDIENWSSATETTGPDPPPEPVISKAVKQKGSGKNKHQKNTSGIRDYSTAPVSNESFNPEMQMLEDKAALTWSNWGKAVRKHYQEEERKGKSIDDLVPNETRSPFSGYEADQEDNVVSKSGYPSQLTNLKDEDSLYEFSTGNDSFNEDMPSTEKAGKYSDVLINSENDFPPLPVESVPNHGLFAGHGWPGEKPKPYMQVKPTASTKKEKSSKSVKPVTQPDKEYKSALPESDDWAPVMAKVLEKTCEPDMWKSQLNEDVQPGKETKYLEKTKSVKAAQPSKVPLVPTNDDGTVVGHHKLFIGPGWPSQPKQCIVTIPKPSERPDILTKVNQQLHETPTSVGGLDGDWQSTLAKMYETSLVEDKWKFELHVNASKFCDVTKPVEMPLQEFIEVKEDDIVDTMGIHDHTTIPSTNPQDGMIYSSPLIEAKTMDVTDTPTVQFRETTETLPISPVPKIDETPGSVPISFTADGATSSKTDSALSASKSTGDQNINEDQNTAMTTSTKKNKKRKSKRKK